MPWCEHCTRFFNPPSLTPEGACPTCGRVIGTPAKAPWHFKLLVAMASVYLGWRGVQGVGWLLDRLG